MRKNKRRKKRLRAVLILLIILFILAGLGGMLYVSHRDKVEKEQRREAALAALDSIPEVTATPAATATPVPTATPTPSLTPVPTILPAFEPENYQGIWYSEDGLTTIDIYDISLKSVSFTYKRVNGKDPSMTAEADVTAEVAGNATQFRFKDSEGNKAKGEFVFDIVITNLHPQTLGDDPNLGADMTITDDPQGFTPRLNRVRRTLVPLAAVSLGILGWNVTQQQQDLAQYQFSHAAGIGVWGIEHRDPPRFRRAQVHLVGANTEATHSNQLFRPGQYLFSQVSAGANA